MATIDTEYQRIFHMSIPEAYEEWERMHEIEEMDDKEIRRADVIQNHVLACTPRNYSEMAIKAEMLRVWMYSEISTEEIVTMWKRDILSFLKGATTSEATLAVAA